METQSLKELNEVYEKFETEVCNDVNYGIIKRNLLNIIEDCKEMPLTSITQIMPECNGDYSMYFPTKDGMNKNILLVGFVSNTFIQVFNDLIDEKLLSFKVCSVLDYAFYGAPIYDIPIASTKSLKGSKLKWLPLLIIKNN